MRNRKVVGLFESRTQHVTLITKGVVYVLPVCDKCKQPKVESTTKKTYKQNDFQVVVTNIPGESCRCTDYYSLDTLTKIELGLKKKSIERDTFISFDDL